MQHLQLEGGDRQFASDRMWNALVPLFQGNNWPQRASALAGAAQRINRGMPVAASIDNFLHTHQDDADVVFMGKIAIALAIIEAEAASPLMVRNTGRTPPSPLINEHYRNSWYFPFMRMLTMGTRSDDPQALCRNVRFVVFNYDRCLELVLFHTLQGYYGLNTEDAIAALSEIEIIHPYGSIGALSSSSNGGVPFGYEHANLHEIALGIRTFTESVDENITAQARRAIAEAQTLVFLGFGFLPQNMDLLAPGDGRKASRIHATTYGVSETDKLVIYEKLRRFFGDPGKVDLGDIRHVGLGSTRSGFIEVNNGTCRNLIENHRIRLAA